MKLIKVERFILQILILTIPLGQFSRLPLSLVGLSNFNAYLNDLLIPLLIFLYLTRKLCLEKSLRLPPFFEAGVLFVSLALLSFLHGLRWLNGAEAVVSFLYLWRWIQYFLLLPITFDHLQGKGSPETASRFLKLLVVSAAVFLVFGFIQFVFFPDFSSYVQHGWDPHYYRFLSTFFDPNFSGIFLTLNFFLVLALNEVLVEFRGIELKLLAGLIFVGVILTFSRSSYLAFFVGLLVYGLIKSPRLLLAFILLFLMTFVAIPRVRNRVIGAVNLDVTARARITDWSKTWQIVKDNWLLGVGFNSFRYAQSRYGYFRNSRGLEIPGGHAGSAADSAILFVWATTGLGGLVSFLLLYLCVWTSSWRKWRQGDKKDNVLHPVILAGLPALLIHSQFVSSVFYPWIMEWLWLVLALAWSFGKNEN